MRYTLFKQILFDNYLDLNLFAMEFGAMYYQKISLFPSFPKLIL